MNHVARVQVWIGKHFGGVLACARGHTRITHAFHRFELAPFRCPLGDDGIERGAILPAITRRSEQRVVFQLGPLQHFAHCTPHLRRGVDVDPVVRTAGRARICRPGHGLAELITGTYRHAAALVFAQADADQVQHRFLHRHFDMLTDPGDVTLVQCGEDRDCHVHAGAAVPDRGPVVGRWSVGETRDAHATSHRLRNGLETFHVRVRTVGAETLDRGVDQARIDFLQIIPAQPHPIQRAGAEVLDQHIGLPNDSSEMYFRLVGFQIQRQAALVRIERQEKQLVVALAAPLAC